VTFTVIADVDTSKDTATPEAVRAEIERLLLATDRRWRFKVYRAEKTEAAAR